MNLKNILTDRLILIPVTFEITQSLLLGSSKEIEKLEIKTDAQWPTKDTMDILPIFNKSLEKDRLPTRFEFWMIVKKDTMHVVGDIGFHGKPNGKSKVDLLGTY